VASVLNVFHCQQKADGYCLAACAHMVLTYLGISCSQDDLARQLGVRPHLGAPSSRLLRLRSAVLDMIYTAGDLEDLAVWLDQGLPALAFVQVDQLPYWRGQQFQHAVVIVGLDTQAVYLLDPAADAAPIRVLRGDFNLAWDEMDCVYAIFRRVGDTQDEQRALGVLSKPKNMTARFKGFVRPHTSGEELHEDYELSFARTSFIINST